MRTKEEIEQILRGYHRQIEKLGKQLETQHAAVARLEAELAALPAEPLKLRVRNHATATHSIFINEFDVADVWIDACEKVGIDPAALAAHICAFGQPDPRDAQLAAADALADAMQGMTAPPAVLEALTAYRALGGKS